VLEAEEKSEKEAEEKAKKVSAQIRLVFPFG
jgi:hypothetical protein